MAKWVRIARLEGRKGGKEGREGEQGPSGSFLPNPVSARLFAETVHQSHYTRGGAIHGCQPHRLGGGCSQNALQEKEGSASRLITRQGKARSPAPEPDLQRVHPLEAGILHRQEHGAVLWGDSAAEEQRSTVERPFEAHQVQCLR